MKVCCRCRIIKQISEFGLNKSTKDGLDKRCKECGKVYRDANKEKISEASKVWRKENHETILIKKKEYYNLHKEEDNARSKKYRDSHKEILKIYFKNHYINNIDSIKVLRKERYWKERDIAIINSSNWYKNNIEKASKTRHNYYLQHREVIIKHSKAWYRNNLLKARTQHRRYYINNIERVKECARNYSKTLRGREADCAHKAKRRCLGYNPINRKFDNSAYHHLRHINEIGEVDNDIGIYIPKDLHVSISHDGFTGRNMDKINYAALSWYISSIPESDLNLKALELFNSYNLVNSKD